MGHSISCCPDKEFSTSNDLDYGTVKTTVEYPKGSSLKLFCDYGNLSALKKLKEIYPSVANEKYLFYKNEIQRMLKFLSEKEKVMLDKLIVYKINFSGTVGYDAHSVSNEKIFIEYFLTGICKRKDKLEEMVYVYQWRKDGMVESGEPKQKVEFKPMTIEPKLYIGGGIAIN